MAVRSLGELTIDVVANEAGVERGMTAAERRFDKSVKQFKRDATRLGKNIATGVALAIPALGYLVKQTIDSAHQFELLADIAGTSSVEFQKFAAAADFIGINQEKLADQLKDVNEKVGEFIATGGGQLQDFFTTVAPKVGVTAEEFKNLSGPEVLQKYVATLEKAGVPHQQMTFYMEALASDASKLLPLLENDAALLNDLGAAAENAGAIIDEDATAAAEKLNVRLFLMQQQAEGVKNIIATDLIGTIADLSDELLGSADSADNATVAADFLSDSLRTLAGAGAAIVGIFDVIGQAIGGLAFTIDTALDGVDALAFTSPTALSTQIPKIISNIGKNKEDLDFVVDDLGKTIQKYLNLVTDLTEEGNANPEGDTKLNQLIEARKRAADALAELNNRTETVGIAGGTDILKQQEDLVKSLRTEEEKLTDTLNEQLKILNSITDISPERREQLEGRITQGLFDNQEAPDIEGVSPEVGGALGEMMRLNDQQEELQEWYDTQLELLDTFRQQHSELNEQWNKREQDLYQQYQEGLAKIDEARAVTSLTATQDLLGSLSQIAEAYAGKQSGIFRALFAVEKAVAIARSIVAIQTGIAQASALPFPQNLSAMASVAAATASIVSTIMSTNIGSSGGGGASIAGAGAGGGSRGTDSPTGTSITGAGLAITDQRGNVSSIRIINAFDPASVGDYLGSDEGSEVIINVARMNSGSMRDAVASP